MRPLMVYVDADSVTAAAFGTDGARPHPASLCRKGEIQACKFIHQN
jgi:hypothetical protein